MEGKNAMSGENVVLWNKIWWIKALIVSSVYALCYFFIKISVKLFRVMCYATRNRNAALGGNSLASNLNVPLAPNTNSQCRRCAGIGNTDVNDRSEESERSKFERCSCACCVAKSLPPRQPRPRMYSTMAHGSLLRQRPVTSQHQMSVPVPVPAFPKPVQVHDSMTDTSDLDIIVKQNDANEINKKNPAVIEATSIKVYDPITVVDAQDKGIHEPVCSGDRPCTICNRNEAVISLCRNCSSHVFPSPSDASKCETEREAVDCTDQHEPEVPIGENEIPRFHYNDEDSFIDDSYEDMEPITSDMNIFSKHDLSSYHIYEQQQKQNALV